jgi:hypothetical protein
MMKNDRLEKKRQHFWWFVLTHFPRFYDWADRHLPIDTLPF